MAQKRSREKEYFRKGILIGILGGVLGNLWASAIYDWAFDIGNIPKNGLVLILSFMFVWFIHDLEKKL
jgi:hypothetical protein